MESHKNPYKLDATLRKVFGRSKVLLERTVLENVLDLALSKDMHKEWIIIQTKHLLSRILGTYADKNKDKILAISIDKPLIVAEMVELSGVSENKAYIKIEELIRDGLLVECDSVFTSDAREIKKYVSVFKNFKFGLIKNKTAVKARLNKKALNTSQIVLLLRTLKNEMVDQQQKIEFKQQLQSETIN
jgi:ribosomal protein L19E